MFLVKAFEYLAIVAIAVAGITQIVIPLWRGTLIFPFFREEGALQNDLSIAKEETREAQLKKAVELERKKAENINTKATTKKN